MIHPLFIHISVSIDLSNQSIYPFINLSIHLSIYPSIYQSIYPCIYSFLRDNTIDVFPFAGVYDFIADINKPVDAMSISYAKFKYSIKDFKYDLKKISKKKNPQDIVNNINVKLTRLQDWYDVLSSYEDNSRPNPFLSIYDWSDDVKNRYKSLKYLTKMDPKNVLGMIKMIIDDKDDNDDDGDNSDDDNDDTMISGLHQYLSNLSPYLFMGIIPIIIIIMYVHIDLVDKQYDKKKVFMNLIRQWMDRLKRSFKFMYQPKRRELSVDELKSKSLYR